jgi:F420H(2)-dependent quinone reductase
MKDSLIKWFMALNTLLIRASGGRFGSRLGTQQILLLRHVGRKSGKPYVTPIAYFYVDGIYMVVASNWGKDYDPAWLRNVLAHSRTLIEVQGQAIAVTACQASAAEYAHLWQYATEHHPPYLDYQKMTTRHIPIVVFTPVTD